MSFLGSITFRRKTQRTSSENDLSTNANDTIYDHDNSIETDVDDSTNSLPNLNTENELIRELKEKLNNVTLKLEIANNEIDRLNIENDTLKKTVNETNKKICVLKKSTEVLSNITPSKTPKKTSTKNKVRTNSCNSPAIPERTSKSLLPNKENTFKNNDVTNKKPKLCVISNLTYDKFLLQDIESKMGAYEYCLYRTRNANIINTVKSLDMKLHNFTMDDYCILLIGEPDFYKTNNYSDIVSYIHNIIKGITHTNIVICLPTYQYKYNKLMFNSRMELFNNLLYHSMQNVENVRIFDTNMYITSDMFNYRSGKINRKGLLYLIHYLKDGITNIVMENQTKNAENKEIIHPFLDPSKQ